MKSKIDKIVYNIIYFSIKFVLLNNYGTHSAKVMPDHSKENKYKQRTDLLTQNFRMIASDFRIH